ncbi:MAG: glutathione S-transferase family protein [Dongiaceae bacterium]
MTDTGVPILYGATYSVYTRIARLALEEKGVPYRLVETDVFAASGPPAEHLRRHPFGRIPVLDHGGFVLYETAAIARYVDEGFPGPPLQPDSAAARARMTQMIGILDSYGYRPMVWDVYVERISAGEEGRAPDEGRIAAGLARSATVLDELEKALEAQGFLAGEAVSLADLHAAPMMAYFRIAPEGAQALARHARLAAWWERMNGRSSLRRTAFARESA